MFADVLIKKPVKSSLITFLFLLFAGSLSSQTVQVVNARTGLPVEGVLLVSEKQTTQTDEQGKAGLDMFGAEETIHFRHSSYLKYNSTKRKIIDRGNLVFLIEDPVRLDEVVVSASRWEQSKAEIPNKIKKLGYAEVLHYNPQTTADLVGMGDGVFIQKSQMGGGSPMIRGFAANRILLVFDGIRMNNAIYRSGNLQNIISVDANSVENSEVIFGPGSVIYGSDALGGVISFNTLNPRLSTQNNPDFSGKIMSRFASANFEKTVHGTLNFGSKKWAAVVSTTFSDFDDLKMGGSGREEYLRPEYVLRNGFDGTDPIVENKNPEIQRYTAYSQFNLLGKIRYRPGENFDLVLSASHSQTSDIPRYDRLIVYRNNRLRYGDWYYGPQIWSLVSGKLQYHKKNLFFDKFSLIAGLQQYTESRHDRNLNNPVRNNRQEDLSIYSINADFVKSWKNSCDLYYGFETYRNFVNSTGSTTNIASGETDEIPSRYPDDSKYESLAGYFSYKIKLNTKIIAQTGARYTATWLNGSFNPEYYNFPFDGFDIKNSALNGNIGIVWHPRKQWQINLTAATGFRSPNIDDVSKIFDSEPGNVVVPNPDLQPEYARSIELGLLKSYAGKARFEINGFYTHLKDAMVRRDFKLNGRDSILYDGLLSKVEALVNADAANIYGVTFSLEYLFSNVLRMHHDLTWTDGADSDGFPVRHAPPVFGSSHMIYEAQKLFADLYAAYCGKLSYEKLAPSEQDKPYLYAVDENGNPFSPAWLTVNLKISYKISNAVRLGGGIENIFDKRYRPYSSGIVAPGRNAILSAVIAF